MTVTTFYEYNFPLQQTSKFVAPLCTFGKVILLSYKTIFYYMYDYQISFLLLLIVQYLQWKTKSETNEKSQN